MLAHVRFLKEFILHPRNTGAVAPSSRWLARAMLRAVEPDRGGVFVEYGPGLGSFTREALRVFGAPGPDGADSTRRFFAIEINPSFVKDLRGRFPALSIHEGCASRVGDFCGEEGVDGVDGIISGLPWAAFPGELQDKLLEPMKAVMRPGARFTTFAYVHALRLPAAKRFREKLGNLFPEVRASRVVWRNFPPAICYTAVRGD